MNLSPPPSLSIFLSPLYLAALDKLINNRMAVDIIFHIINYMLDSKMRIRRSVYHFFLFFFYEEQLSQIERS